jgi:hypothetical protein
MSAAGEGVGPTDASLMKFELRDGVISIGANLSRRELFAALIMARIARPSLTRDGVKLRAEIAVAHADALLTELAKERT